MARLSTMDDLDVEGQRVLLRADLNAGLAPASAAQPVHVVDDSRIRAALPTIEELLRRGARLVLVADLDAPRGAHHVASMRPVAERLSALTGTPVPLAPGVTGGSVRELTERLPPGSMLMLENVRFAAGESSNDPPLASALAELADLYVNDAFARAHRAYASTEGVAHLLPSAAGRLMAREIHALTAIVEQPARPFVAILGGSTVRDTVGLTRRLLELADVVCVGGAMAFPFLAARGHGLGRAHCAAEDLEPARRLLHAPAGSARLELPSDLILPRATESKGVEPGAGHVAQSRLDLDIGPETADRYAATIAAAASVFWHGEMGRVKVPSFAGGTRAIADAVASTSAMTVVSGAEAVRALRSCELQDRVSHVSTGELATLEFLEGRELPGVEVLRDVPVAAQ